MVMILMIGFTFYVVSVCLFLTFVSTFVSFDSIVVILFFFKISRGTKLVCSALLLRSQKMTDYKVYVNLFFIIFLLVS